MKPNEYKIITANNYETVKLDGILSLVSETDTDKDELTDWKETNITLIEKLKPGVTDKGYLTMDDMPTIEQLKKHQIEVLKNSTDAEEKNDSYFYVESGLNRYMSENGSNPYSALFVPVVPIVSVPVDADGDNDGVIDLYDSQRLNGNNRTPEKNNDEAEEFGIAEYYEMPKEFTIDFTLEGNERYMNEIYLHVKPFYDSEQYKDVVLNQDDIVYADYLIISRGIPEKSEDGKSEFRRIKYWIKVKVGNRYGYLPFDVLKFTECDEYGKLYDINRYVETKNLVTVNSKNADVKNPNSNIFSGWYYPLPDSVGVISKIHMLSQRVQTCTATCHAMGYNYFLSRGVLKSDKGIISNSNDELIWNSFGATWSTIGNLKLESMNLNDSELLSGLRRELEKGYPIILGASDSGLKYYEEFNCFAGGINHFVLVVGYEKSGEDTDDYIIIDPYCILDQNGNLGNNKVSDYYTTEAANYYLPNYLKKYSNYFVSYDDEKICVDGVEKYIGIRKDYYYCKSFIMEDVDE